MARAFGDRIDRVANDLTAAGIDLPHGWRDAIRTGLLPDLEIDDLDPSEPDDLVAAQFAFMNLDLDDVSTIVFLQAMHDLLSVNARETKPAYARAGKNQFMTRIVLTRRLASRYFHEGRRRVDGSPTAASGTWMLDRSLRLTLGIVDRDDRASHEVLRMMHSQIATASAHLARTLPRDDSRRADLLRVGSAHSGEAERYGDRTPDHDGYAIELALRLHELAPEHRLDHVLSAIERTRGTATAALQGLNGDICFARAMNARADRDMAQAATQLSIAVDHYDKAINIPHDERGPDVGYLIAKRGRCHALLFESAADSMGSRDTIVLDRAIADWFDPRSEPHRRDHEASRMLLARARLASARGNPEAAAADITHAALLLADDHHPGPSGQLQRQGLEVALERALDDGDPEAALEALDASSALPHDAPAPAGAMTKTALWLLRHMTEPEWVQVVRTALDRIEVDAAHPSLSPSARGHVTGHAATLARVLARSAEAGPADVLRAVELSRAHLQATADRSAAALDGASEAAAAYAGLRRETTEAPSVDTLGGWLDALMWGLSALQTERTIRTTVRARFDLGACAVRVAEAADAIHEATGDSTYYDTALDALAIAETLTVDPRIGPGANPRIAVARASLRLSMTPNPPSARSQVAPSTTPVRRRRRATRPAGPPRPGEAASEMAAGLEAIPMSTSAASTLQSRPAHEAWRSLAEADMHTGQVADDLRHQAAERFCELVGTHDRDLGGKTRSGQRGVTIVDDRTGLARQLVVLKRVDRMGAKREYDALRRLTTWRSNQHAQASWSLPDALGIVDINQKDTVLVMRRLPGHTLAHHTMEHLDGRAQHPLHMFEQAAQALADFHTGMIGSATVPEEDPARTFLKAAAQLTTTGDARTAWHSIEPILTTTAQLAKKDAHAGNWIWSTASGGLILLDIEGATTRPAILELATLLDDLPIVDLDADGWRTRIRIAERYIDRLPQTHRQLEYALRHHLEAAMLHAATAGRARLQRRTWGASSRGIRFAGHQHHHYGEVTAHLAQKATNVHVRRAATEMLGPKA